MSSRYCSIDDETGFGAVAAHLDLALIVLLDPLGELLEGLALEQAAGAGGCAMVLLSHPAHEEAVSVAAGPAMLDVEKRGGELCAPDAPFLRPPDCGQEEHALLLTPTAPRELGEPLLVQGEGFALLNLRHLGRQLCLEVIEIVRLVVGLEDCAGDGFHDLASFSKALRPTSSPRMWDMISSKRTITSGLIEASRGA